MTSANRVRMSYVKESTLGTTPGSPAMKKIRITGETLAHQINFLRSEEIRDDRLPTDTTTVGAQNQGGFNFELSYGAFDDFLAAAFFSAWSETPERQNVTGDDVVTAVTASSDTYTVTTGAAFAEGHLVRATGFTNAGNNGLLRAASGSGATALVTPDGRVDEAAPPAGARLKVVGFQGATGDIAAAAGGLTSSALDFTTLGLAVGQWIKIGGAAAGNQFATAVLNGFARITAIAAHALTLDNKPAGWTTDAGTGKDVQVWVSDFLTLGTTRQSFTIEKVFLGQAVPKYLLYRGMIVNQMTLQGQIGQQVTGSFDFLGTSHAISASPLDASPDEADQNAVMNNVANVSRLAEGGGVVAGPDWISSFTLTLGNNLRGLSAIGNSGFVDVTEGDIDATFELSTYFGSTTLYEKMVSETESALNLVLAKAGKALVIDAPRVKYEAAGGPNAQGRNQDVLVNLTARCLRDATTGRALNLCRFEEYAS